MNGQTPHLVQYQGSKRLLAPQILRYMPRAFNRLLEPFAGMAAISIAAANERRARRYCLNDINQAVVRLLRAAIETPGDLAQNYTNIWMEQFTYPEGHPQHFYAVRDRFNAGEQTAEIMLYLLARCVKGAARYGKNGNFNQSPDTRRHGTNPKTLAKNISAIADLLKGQTDFSTVDYRQILEAAEPGDLVYMDPPYQGVSGTKDNRYVSGIAFDDFTDAIHLLNRKKVDYIISYDGACGDKAYGNDLPRSLHCAKFLLDAGRSAQATLLGKRDMTREALYVSESLGGARR
jgi:DNA adenine methylase